MDGDFSVFLCSLVVSFSRPENEAAAAAQSGYDVTTEQQRRLQAAA